MRCRRKAISRTKCRKRKSLSTSNSSWMEAERKIATCHGYLIQSTTPEDHRSDDWDKDVRDDATIWKQSDDPNIAHPSATDAKANIQLPYVQREVQHANLANVVDRHKCTKGHCRPADHGDGSNQEQNEKNIIYQFTPSYPSNRNGKNYSKFCRFSLVKYRPWSGRPFENDAIEDEECIPIWETFLEELRAGGKDLPPTLRRVVDLFEEPDEAKDGRDRNEYGPKTCSFQEASQRHETQQDSSADTSVPAQSQAATCARWCCPIHRSGGDLSNRLWRRYR